MTRSSLLVMQISDTKPNAMPGTWNRARTDVALQDCWALTAWFGVRDQVKQRMG
jgi:hypothetical protein